MIYRYISRKREERRSEVLAECGSYEFTGYEELDGYSDELVATYTVTMGDWEGTYRTSLVEYYNSLVKWYFILTRSPWTIWAYLTSIEVSVRLNRRKFEARRSRR